MKRTFLLYLIFIARYAYSQGYTHFQTYAEINSYHHKNDNKVWLSMGKSTDNRVAEYDMSTRDFVFLNDSAPSFRTMLSNGNKGVALTLNSKIYYTSDNWKTISPSAETGISAFYRTNDGFIGLKEIDRFNGEFYHSTDGNTWTKTVTVAAGVTSNYSYRVVSVNSGKIWLMGDPRKFYVSYDGGNSFELKEPAGAPSTFFWSFTAFDTLNAIGTANNGDLYRTMDGGNSWTKLIKKDLRLIYIHRMDSILAYHPVDGLVLSNDSGTNWTSVSYTTPPGFTSTPDTWNASGGYLTFRNQTGFYYTDGLNRPWRQLRTLVKTNRCVAAKGNVMIVGGEDGNYAYSRNNGRTFIPGDAPLGSEDLFACAVVNDTLAMMADRKSNIFVSKNGGASWQQKYSNGFNYIGIKFRYSADLSKIILRRAGQLVFSNDGAATWNVLGSVGGSFDATVTPSGKILIVMWYGNVMRIAEMGTDGNRTDVKLLDEDLTPMGIEMINDNLGYCFGIKTSTGEVYTYKTTDGWGTFALQSKYVMPGASPIFHIPGGIDTVFINFRNTSNADASLNTIYRTFNGGQTWSTDTVKPVDDPNYKEKLQYIHFFNPREYVSMWDDNRIFFNRSANDTSSNPGTFVRKVNDLEHVNVYPNPATTIIYVESPDNNTATELYDLAGKKIWSGTGREINVSTFPAGIYYLKVISNDKSAVRKVIKQ